MRPFPQNFQRWKQTGENGHVPAHGGWENVFMAVAIDDDIDLHPKNKRIPASRLGWAAANLVYGQEDKPLQGPQLAEIQKDGVMELKNKLMK